MTKNFIRVPYGLSVHGRKEISAVNKVLKSSTQMGKHVYEFEKNVAKLFNKKYGLMVNSGSSALILALKVMNFKSGSEIITPCHICIFFLSKMKKKIYFWLRYGLVSAINDY